MTRLLIPRYAAVGLLELLWHFTAKFAPAGDIGKWQDSAIASAVSWGDDPARLVEALTACDLLDPNEGCRLYVHDWHDHAEESVHRALARAHRHFANGAVPNISGLDAKEKEAAKAFYGKTKKRGKSGATPGPRGATPGETRHPAVAVAVAGAVAVALALPEPEPTTTAPPPPCAHEAIAGREPAPGRFLVCTTCGEEFRHGPRIDHDGLAREGYRLAGEEAKARGVDIQDVLREASTIPASGWYLLALEGAKPEHLQRTVIRLRDNAKARAERAAPAVDDIPDVSKAPELAAEFLAWYRLDVVAGRGETQGQASARWMVGKGIPFGKPLQVAISQHVRALLARPVEA